MGDKSDLANDESSVARTGIGWQIVRRASLAGYAVCLITLATFFASQFWWADLLVHFRIQYVLLLSLFLVIVAFNRMWKTSVLFFIFLTANLFCVVPYLGIGGQVEVGGVGEDCLRIMSANVLSSNADVAAISRVFNQADADIVAVIEVSEAIAAHLQTSCPDYKYQYFEPCGDNFGIGVISKVPLKNVELVSTSPLNLPSYIVAFDFGGQECVLIATHAIPPRGAGSTKWRDEHLNQMAEYFEGHEADVKILVGDFNQTPWSPRFRQLLEGLNMVDASLGFGVQPTWQVFPTYLGGLKIDHLLVSPQVKTVDFQVVPIPGSDHNSVLADLEIVVAK